METIRQLNNILPGIKLVALPDPINTKRSNNKNYLLSGAYLYKENSYF